MELRSPLTAYFALAFALTWALLPFAQASRGTALLALFGPAAAAVIAAAWGGRQQLRDLRGRIMEWRVPIRWYVVALLLPLPISALASGLEYLWGAHGPIRPQPITVLGVLVFVLVVGEEIGWRGFALPRLLTRFGPWSASAALGALWALWHLPLFHLAGMPQFGSPFLPYIAYTIALSIILTFLAQHTRGSVIIATLFHGAVNTFGVINTGASPSQRGWGNAISYGLAALAIGIGAWTRRSSVTASAADNGSP
jgi:membrane protease YdiL (CAAX protease family)